MTRLPAVADRFYPGNKKALDRTLDELIPSLTGERTRALSIVSPHAGYVFSGSMAGKTMAQVHVPETVLIIGPNHYGQGAPVAVSTTPWQTPLGVVPSDDELTSHLIGSSPLIQEDEVAHQQEHSLEVQVPFLQRLQPQLRIAAMAISQLPYSQCEEIAECISSVIEKEKREVLLVASSDMSHYEPRHEAKRKDYLALDQVLEMNPRGLFDTVFSNNISMCGVRPVTIALQAALNLGATKAELVGYTDSGKTTGDTAQVVGYAGLIIS